MRQRGTNEKAAISAAPSNVLVALPFVVGGPPWSRTRHQRIMSPLFPSYPQDCSV